MKARLMIIQRLLHPFRYIASLILSTIFLSHGEPVEQQLLAVFDLTSDSSVTTKFIKTISDKISSVVEQDSTYSQFNREMLPELFNQLAIDHSALVCSDPQCLIVLGNLIGANAIIGGFIKTTGRQIAIELNLVNASEKRIINTVSLTTAAKRVAFIDNELPELVKNLLSSQKNSSPLASKSFKKKNIFSNPLLYAGTLVVGGAAAAAYYFLVHEKSNDQQPISEPINPPLSIDDIPIPGRSQ